MVSPSGRLHDVTAPLRYPRTFWLLWTGTIVNRIGLLVLPFLSLFLTGTRGLSVEEATLVLGLHGAGAFAAGAVGGALSDRIGRKAVLVGSLAGGAALIAAIPLANSFAGVSGLVAAYGFVGEMYRPAVSAVVSDTVDPARQRQAFALLYWAINVGAAVGPAIGGALADHSFAWLFTIDAASMAVYALVILLGVPETRPAVVAGASRAAGGLGRALRDGQLVLITVVVLAVGVAFGQSFTTLPLAMQADGLSKSAYGLVIGLNGAIVVALSLPVARWMERHPEPVWLALAVALVALGVGSYAFASTALGYAGGVVLWSLGEIALLPVLPALVARLAPDGLRGTYQGVYHSGWGLSHVLGPVLGGQIFGRFGADMLWTACLVLGLATAAAVLVLRVGQHRPGPEAGGSPS